MTKDKTMTDLFETLAKDLRPERFTEDVSEAKKHLDNGGIVIHDGKEVAMLHRMTFGEGYGKYEGYLSGDWMVGIFTLR